MRRTEEVQDAMFSYISAEQRVPKDHPLRPIRRIMDEVLKRLPPEFEQMYSTTVMPPIAPRKPDDQFSRREEEQRHPSVEDGSGMPVVSKRGQESLLCYLGHVVTENRNGLVIKAQVSTRNGNSGTRQCRRDDLRDFPFGTDHGGGR